MYGCLCPCDYRGLSGDLSGSVIGVGFNAPVIGWNTVWYFPFLVKSDEMVDPGTPPDIAIMSFEDALAELEQIVRRLEGGQVKLDEAILSYERGAQLKRHCERKLNEAQQRVDRIVIGPEGAVTTEPAKFE